MQDEQASHGGELSPRELEVPRVVAAGLTNREIAQRFWVTETTVKFHLTRIYRRIGVSNRTAAAMWLQREVIAAAPEAPQTSSVLTSSDSTEPLRAGRSSGGNLGRTGRSTRPGKPSLTAGGNRRIQRRGAWSLTPVHARPDVRARDEDLPPRRAGSRDEKGLKGNTDDSLKRKLTASSATGALKAAAARDVHALAKEPHGDAAELKEKLTRTPDQAHALPSKRRPLHRVRVRRRHAGTRPRFVPCSPRTRTGDGPSRHRKCIGPCASARCGGGVGL